MSQLSDIVIGSTISFRSKAVNDNNFYYGKVIGINTAEVAVTYTDIYTYNTSVQSADLTVPDADLLSFFLIKLIEPVDNTTRYIVPFASDWINLPTLSIISTDRIATIKVYDVDESNVQDVINLLATAGFKARIDSLK